jgi:hypothetical protein
MAVGSFGTGELKKIKLFICHLISSFLRLFFFVRFKKRVLRFQPACPRQADPLDRQMPRKPRLIGGVKGHNINDTSSPGSPVLWTGSFTPFSIKPTSTPYTSPH